MGLRAWIAGVCLASAIPCAAEEVLLQPAPWPVVRECTNCIPLQFGRLEMHLPRSEVSKILVIGRGDSVVNFVPSTGDPMDGAFLYLVEQSRVLGLHAKTDLLHRYGVKTARDFYDLLGKPSAGDRTLKVAKQAEMTVSAIAYTRASKGDLHVYRIECAEPEMDRVHFVIDGDEGLYMLAGPVSRELYEAILANLRVVKAP